MSGIVIDLEKDALQSDVGILDLLRKALVVANKLKLTEFENWVNYEMNGYPIETDVPTYRSFRGEIKAWNPYHGWIAVISKSGSVQRTFQSRDPIANLIDVYKKTGSNEAMVPITGELAESLNSNGPTYLQTKYALFISASVLFSAIENVRTNVLKWALLLENNGVIGENLFFSEDEKHSAQNTPGIVNYTMNFYGNVTDSQVQQNTNESKQDK